MKAAKENDAVSAEQHIGHQKLSFEAKCASGYSGQPRYARESIRIARATRELLKKFAAAHHIFHETEDFLKCKQE